MDKTGWKTDDQPLDLEKLVNPRIMGMGKWDVSGKIVGYDDITINNMIVGRYWERFEIDIGITSKWYDCFNWENGDSSDSASNLRIPHVFNPIDGARKRPL